MELARFGNWAVNAFKIEWKGDEQITFAISIPNIVTTGSQRNCILYQWLIEIAADTRFSTEDIYSLNTAFFFALDNFRTEINIPSHALIAETLKEQQELLNARKGACEVPITKYAQEHTSWFGKISRL